MIAHGINCNELYDALGAGQHATEVVLTLRCDDVVKVRETRLMDEEQTLAVAKAIQDVVASEGDFVHQVEYGSQKIKVQVGEQAYIATVSNLEPAKWMV